MNGIETSVRNTRPPPGVSLMLLFEDNQREGSLPSQVRRRRNSSVLSFQGAEYPLTCDAVKVVEALIARRDARERDLIFAEAVRRLELMRESFGKRLWFSGVEFSSAELSLEERGDITVKRRPVISGILQTI